MPRHAEIDPLIARAAPRRIAQAVAQVAAGKSREWKYETR